jgi:D-3-phosphoglycerate dehydrogenase
LINRENLTRVRRGAYLINLARGAVIESLDVLYDALQDGRLAGVALDVFEPEPPDPNHPIFQLENCLTAPHAMALTVQAMKNIFRSMADDMAAVFRGQRPQYIVNPQVF